MCAHMSGNAPCNCNAPERSKLTQMERERGRRRAEGRGEMLPAALTLKRPRTPSAAIIARKARKLPRNGKIPGCRPRCVAADTYTHVNGVATMDCTASIRFALALFRLMRPRSTAASLRSGRTCSAGQGRGTAMRQTKLDTVSRSGWSIVCSAAATSRSSSNFDPTDDRSNRRAAATSSAADALLLLRLLDPSMDR